MINQSENESPVDEVAGGIKNAIERGQSLGSVKQSFLNAGYKREIVESAARKISGISSMPSTALTQMRSQEANQEIIKIKPAIYSSEKSHKLLIIVLITISVLILVGAGILGLYWEKIISLFS